MSELGHNSVNGEHLRAYIERIERAEAEKADAQEFISQLYTEAKSNGFDPKQLRRVIRERKRDKKKAAEEDSTYDLYMRTLAMKP